MTKESDFWKILVDSEGYVIGFKEDFKVVRFDHFKKATQSE
jgi:hypothetical protein